MNHIILSAILLLLFSFPLLAKGKYVDPYKGYEESAFMDMDIENNIQTPVVGEGEHQPIVKHMRRIGDSLAKKAT